MFFRKPRKEFSAGRTLRTFGLEESAVRELLKDAGLNLEILSHPKGVDIRIVVEGAENSAALAVTDAAELKIRNRLGEAVFGTDNDRMEEVVGKLLLDSGKTLSTAESCTGGLVGHMITNVPGSSRYFKQGFIVYDDAAKIKTLNVSPGTLKQFGSVSAPAVEEMAKNARGLAGTDSAVAVSGIAGPAGGGEEKPVGTVFICASAGETVKTGEFHFKGWRELMKIQFAQAALDLLRLTLIQDRA